MNEEIEKINRTIDQFAEAMKSKMLIKHTEGRRGWDDAIFLEDIREGLKRHVEKEELVQWGQEVDIANFAMMLWNFRRNHVA